jgi:metal-dependent HD superfamily phosphatase/phosphodiesterase
MVLNIPVGDHAKLKELISRIEKNVKLKTYWQCSNINAIDRLGINDHGPIHIKIVSNLALLILRLLIQAGIKPSVCVNYQLTEEDAELIVILATALHDIGHIVHRDKHEEFSIALAPALLDELLDGLYAEREEAIVTAETLHAMIAHDTQVQPFTVEAGVLKVADALDMEQGRARIPFSKGSPTIHAVSAMAIEKVRVRQGDEKPVCIEIRMSNSAGIFQLDNLLKPKLQNSGLKEHFEIRAEITGAEKKIIEKYEI